MNAKEINKKVRYDTALNVACSKGNNEAVDLQLAKSGTDVNVEGDGGRRPLQSAIVGNNLEAVSKLLAMPDIEVNAKTGGGSTPLQVACYTNTNHKIIEKLLAFPGIDTKDKNGKEMKEECLQMIKNERKKETEGAKENCMGKGIARKKDEKTAAIGNVKGESSKEEQMENENIGKREANHDGVGKSGTSLVNGIEHAEDDIILDTRKINGKSPGRNSDANEDEEISFDRKRVSKKAPDVDEKAVFERNDKGTESLDTKESMSTRSSGPMSDIGEVSDEEDQKFGANEDGKDEFARKSRKEHLANENPVVKVEIVEDVLEHDTKLLSHRDKLDPGMLIEAAASFPLLQAQRGESVAPSLNLIQSPTKAVEELDKEQKVARKPALIIAKLEDGSMRVEVMANLDGSGIISKDMLSWVKMDIEYVQVLVVIAARANMNVSAISYNPFVEYVSAHEELPRETPREVAMAKQSEFNVESYSLAKHKEKLFNNHMALVHTGQFDPGIRDSIGLNESSGALPTEYRQISIGNKEYGEFVMDSRLGEPGVFVEPREGIGVYKDSASTHTPSKFFINSDKFFKGSMLAANNEKSPNSDKQLEHPTRIVCNQGTLPNSILNYTSLGMRRDTVKKCMELIKEIAEYKDKLPNCHCQFDPGISCNQQGGLELLRTEPQFRGEQRRASVQLSGGSERGVHGRGVQVERLEAGPQCGGHPA